ncbi:MAG: transposase [Bacilli bacterium]
MTKKKYEESFKLKLVQLVNSGKSINSVSKEYGVVISTLHSWVHKYNGTVTPSSKSSLSDEQKQIIQLKKELKRANMERDILKEVALIFGKK